MVDVTGAAFSQGIGVLLYGGNDPKNVVTISWSRAENLNKCIDVVSWAAIDGVAFTDSECSIDETVLTGDLSLKLSLLDNTLTASYSADGIAWIDVDTFEITRNIVPESCTLN
jgi:hypothetical protein